MTASANASNRTPKEEGFDFFAAEETTCKAIRDNIETISRLEEKFRTNRKPSEVVADAIGTFSGSMKFVLIHVALFTAWILINTGAMPIMRPFDPYPFMFLNMAVSLEAIFLSTFVMMKQNRMSKRADSRAHLDLQINLLAEKEMTMVLQMLRLIGKKVGVRSSHLDVELAQLSEHTPIEALANVIEEKFPNDD